LLVYSIFSANFLFAIIIIVAAIMLGELSRLPLLRRDKDLLPI